MFNIVIYKPFGSLLNSLSRFAQCIQMLRVLGEESNAPNHTFDQWRPININLTLLNSFLFGLIKRQCSSTELDSRTRRSVCFSLDPRIPERQEVRSFMNWLTSGSEAAGPVKFNTLGWPTVYCNLINFLFFHTYTDLLIAFSSNFFASSSVCHHADEMQCPEFP